MIGVKEGQRACQINLTAIPKGAGYRLACVLRFDLS
jgi:hypothetical protein